MELLEPIQELQLDTEAGPRTYRIGHFSAVQGRAIIMQYPTTALPKIGDYGANEALMVEVMGCVERVLDDGTHIRLGSKSLINNHVPDTETLIRLEGAALMHNFSFFRNGKLSGLGERLLQSLPNVISQMLTASQQASSAKAPQRSTN